MIIANKLGIPVFFISSDAKMFITEASEALKKMLREIARATSYK
jgi:hypothetical protein